MFKLINDAIAVSFKKGFFQEHKVFEYKGNLYLQWGKRFVALQKNGCAMTGVSIDELLLPFKPVVSQLGYLQKPTKKGK